MASVQKAVMVRPEVKFVSASEIFDPAKNLKARRFLDQRKFTPARRH
jgi:hypothetical protein